MQNIQDLKDKIFFEFKNMIRILSKINNVDELLSKQNLIDELTERISFLQQLERKVNYYRNENVQLSEILLNQSPLKSGDFSLEVTEEEVIFNNELNEIDGNENRFLSEVAEEEAIFNNQLNEIVENEFHENMVSLAEEEHNSGHPGSISDEKNQSGDFESQITEKSADFDCQLNEIDEENTLDQQKNVLSFIDEERILGNSEPEDDETVPEEIFDDKVTEEEDIFNNQLNEIDDSEHETSDQNVSESFKKEKIQDYFGSETSKTENPPEIISGIYYNEDIEDEILIGESENRNISKDFTHDEIATENSSVVNILADIKKDTDDQSEERIQDSERGKIVDINKPSPETEKDTLASDESFENLDAYNQEKKIRLANIKGLKTIQTLFDDDPLEREIPQQKTGPTVKEDAGNLLKMNIPTDYMEAEKQKQEFRLDLNDRMAFTKMLFGGSQTDLNKAVSDLNQCRNLEEAKEYLSDLYYERKWNKVDEYAQRLWILVENKFL